MNSIAAETDTGDVEEGFISEKSQKYHDQSRRYDSSLYRNDSLCK